MIPKHLQGKSAAQICSEMKTRWFILSESIDREDYILLLEGFMLQAVTHALCNADEVIVESDDKSYKEMVKSQEAEGRAIAFLNIVLPYEEKNGN
jgi:hypothetical protein